MKRSTCIAVLLVVTIACVLTVAPEPPGPSHISPAHADTQFTMLDWPDPVQPDKVWWIRFSSPVDVQTVTASRFRLLDATGASLPVQLRIRIDGLAVGVRPVQPLAAGQYRLQVMAGLKDKAGHPLQQPLQINFSVTADSIAQDETEDSTATADNAGAMPGAFGPMSSAPVDFAVSSADLDLPTLVSPGAFVSVRLTVRNASPSTGLAGGSVVRVLLDGRVIDEVPFYLAAGQDDQVVRASVYLPEGPYKSLKGQDRATAQVTAIVDPYGRTSETNEGNNTVSGAFQVRPDGDEQLHDTDPPMTVDASGLSVLSTKNDAANDVIKAALPGQILHLKARLSTAGNDSTEDVNVKFLVNGIVVLDDNRRVGRPSSGFSEVSCDYIVPYNARGPLHFQVLLSNGSSASINVPVLRWDTEVRAGDLYWASTPVAVPGQPLYLHAVIKNTSSLSCGSSDAKIACRVLVDGQPFYEHEYTMLYDELYITVPKYDVPAGQTTPVVFTVVTDPYDQLPESAESNNVATIEIPLANQYPATPDLWLGPADLTYIARPIVPGSHVLLSAAIHNRSSQVPPKNVRVQFKINGQVVADVTKERGIFEPLQAQLVTCQWIAPLTLSGRPKLEVVIDPDNVIDEGSEDNNGASLDLEVAQPDLEPAAPALSWTPQQPVAGQPVTLRAVVRNNGLAAADGAVVRFLIDDQSVGDATIASIGAASGGVATLNWTVPPGEKLQSLPWSTLRGQPGKLPLSQGLTHDLQLSALIDPEERIAESDETNNAAGSVTMTVTIPSDKKLIWVNVTDEMGGVPAAAVTLATTGASAETVTGDDGWCSFTGVPEGAYTLTVSKPGYLTQTVNAQAGSQSSFYSKHIVLAHDGDVILITENDRDHDLLSDELEGLYGTNPDDPDTDDDGVIDGKDISPLIDPTEPAAIQFRWVQEPGMVRLEQPICAYGLDGWCEVWDMDWSFSSWSNHLDFVKRYDEHGTRKSTMTQEKYRKAVDSLFSQSGFKSWGIRDVAPLEIGYGDTEMVADDRAENSWTFPADAWHRTEYRIYYNYVTDYQVVSLKNETTMVFPSEESFFKYLLVPLQQLPGLAHSYDFQFVQPGLADQISVTDATHYRELGIQYALYGSNTFTDDGNLPLAQGISLVDSDGSDLFSFSITLPAQAITGTTGYLKLTPVWANRTGGPDPSIQPATLEWNLTGLVRNVVYSEDATGNSTIGSYHARSLDDLAVSVRTLANFRGLESDPLTKVKSEWSGVVNVDPNAAVVTERVSAIESNIKILAYAGKAVGLAGTGAEKGFEKLVERKIQKIDKKATIKDLPADHWIKSAKYEKVLSGIAAVAGVISICSNGLEAYVAAQQGDTITCTYYLARGVTSTAETAVSLASVSKTIAAYSGKTGRFAKLTSNEVAVGLAVAVGVVETSYNLAKWSSTDNDAIKKSAYGERAFASAIDTGIAIAAVFVPVLAALDVVWMGLNELFYLWHGNAISHEIAKSPSSAIVFLSIYAWGSTVPTQVSIPAYEAVRDRLMIELVEMNDFGKPFVPVFIDPNL